MRLIETAHLKTWAGSKSADGRFPYIVKSLICAVIQPEKLRIPSGDAIWVPGYDGEVTSSDVNRFVPTGKSVWEVGTGSKIKDKADKDYEKRSLEREGKKKKLVPQKNLSETTFVFATPRVWKGKDRWIDKRKKEGIWFDVQVIDGVDITDWLEMAQAVNLQFAAEIGLVPEEGLQTPDHAWEEWSQLTDPPVLENLVVAGRGDHEKEVINRLIASPSTFSIRGDSPREALGFALATIRRVTSEGDRQSLYSRLIVADNEEVAGRLRHLNNLIIILKYVKKQVSGLLSSRGCHVIVSEGHDSRSEHNVIVLGRPTHGQFSEALKKMGINEPETERESRACGLSVTILQRRRAHASFTNPPWAEGEAVNDLLPALLAGRWNSSNNDDQRILCQLTATDDYVSVESRLHRFLLIDEPPLRKIGELWTLTAPVDAFQLTARYLTAAHMDRFKIAFRDVFGRIDPKVEVPPDEWLNYDIKGEKGHSGWLRSGMAETLLLIAERGKDAQIVCISSPRSFTDEVVRGLPGLNDDWRLLASIRDQYSRLVEAAPYPFLDSLELLIEKKPEDIRKIFVESEGIFGGGSMHTGLLWGLEALAWSPECLPRVSLILAKLSYLDPGGRIANRPINSLREIFLWWHPGTNATIEEKLAAIDLILERETDIGWKLLANLLPQSSHSISHMTSQPRWRDIGDMPKEARTRRGEAKYLSAIVDRALDHVGADPERWQEILDSLRYIRSDQQERAITLLRSVVQGQVPDEKKKDFWETLRDFVNKHRAFRDTDWALAEELLKKMDDILYSITPKDPVERNRWLFDEWFPDLPSREEDIDQNEKQVEQLRERAVAEIFQTQGLEGLVRLGVSCNLSGFVASAAVPLMESIEQIRCLVERAISSGESGIILAGQISGHAKQLHGEAWRNLVLNNANVGTWPQSVIASLMVWWPDEMDTWKDAESLGDEVAAEYWRRKQVVLTKHSPDEQLFQIDRLIKAKRASEAFDRIAPRGRGVPTETLVRLFDATFEELAEAKTIEEIRRLRLNSYDMRKYLEELRRREDLPQNELARREYMALPLLGLDNRGLTIHKFMAEDPNFFVDVICDVFLPAHRDKSKETEPTSEEQARAQAAFRLLEGMDQIPGQGEGNQIDEEILFQWIVAVRKKALARDREAIVDLKIGEILAQAPQDPEDGGWPHRIVRDVIEKLKSDDIDHGLIIKRFNMRGVVSKAMYEGGAQERILADNYRGWAKISKSKWPRMTRVLEAIARDWEEHARQEDARAEQQKIE